MNAFRRILGMMTQGGQPGRSRHPERTRFRPVAESLGARALLSGLDTGLAAVVPLTFDVGTTGNQADQVSPTPADDQAEAGTGTSTPTDPSNGTDAAGDPVTVAPTDPGGTKVETKDQVDIELGS